MASKVLEMIKEREVKFVDLRFTDTRGKEQHVSMPASMISEDDFTDGKMFDGSSISGWKGINESDMVLMPDASTAVLDPFTDETTINITCDILEPSTMEAMSVIPAPSPSVPKPTCSLQVSPILLTSVLSLSSSF